MINVAPSLLIDVTSIHQFNRPTRIKPERVLLIVGLIL